MKSSENIDKIVAALIEFQGELKPAVKDASNPAFKSKYATLESAVDACRELLHKNKLAVIQSPSFSDGRLVMTTRLLHESTQWFETELSVKIANDTPQGIGSAITYTRRYTLLALLGIVTDDDDGNASSMPAAPAPRSIPRPVQPTNAELQKKAEEEKKRLEDGQKMVLAKMADMSIDAKHLHAIFPLLKGHRPIDWEGIMNQYISKLEHGE